MDRIVDLKSKADVIAAANAYDHTEERPYYVKISADCLLDESARPALGRFLNRISPREGSYMSLKLYDSRSERIRRAIPATLVATVMEQLGQTDGLQVDGIDFDLQEGARTFFAVLGNQQLSLKDIDLGHDSRILGDGATLAKFGETLMELHNLEELTISFKGMSMDEICSLSSFFPRICTLKSLVMYCWTMPSEEDDTVFLTNLQQAKNIKRLLIFRTGQELDLVKGSTLDAVRSLLCNTSLQCLSIDVNTLAAMRGIAKSLGRANTRLKKICTRMRDPVDICTNRALAVDDIAGPFLEVLSCQNFSLTELDAECRVQSNTVRASDHPDISFYLNLNKTGRSFLLKNEVSSSTDRDWLNAIIASSDNVATTFYWLQCNPSFCQKADLCILEMLDRNIADGSTLPGEEPQQVCFGETWVTVGEINSKCSVFVDDSRGGIDLLLVEPLEETNSCSTASSAVNEVSVSDLVSKHKRRAIYLDVGINAAFVVGCYCQLLVFKKWWA